MRIPLDPNSSTPFYRQIQGFLQEQIASGALVPDTRLPASRELAVSLGVSRLTVTNAYAELESQGLVYSIQGDGTHVAQLPPTLPRKANRIPEDDWPTWQRELHHPVWRPASQKQDELIASVSHPNPISFAEGCGDSKLFPKEDFRKAVQHVLRHNDTKILGYGDSSGYPPLRMTIAKILTGQGIPTHPDQVLITSGSQQAINLTVRLLAKSGDKVLAEGPTHMGFLDLCHSLDIQVLEVPVDDQGMQVDRVETLLSHDRPKLIFTVPNYQNPTGTCLSSIRRRQLVALAERYQVPILEDDFVGDLRYKGSAQPALKALDSIGNVIYVSTFSKMLIPSLRVGFMVADGAAYDRLHDLKHTSDVTSSNLMQQALDAYITVGRYQACLRRARQIFNKRRVAMLTALAQHMPVGVRWNIPQGGLFIWLELPDNLSADVLFPLAGEAGVIFTPGSLFFPGARPTSFLRLNFAIQPLQAIEEGILKLGSTIREYMANNR